MSKSKVISLRLHEHQLERLERLGRRLGRSPSEAAALLLEEALRMAEFSLITFRDSPVGRQAYVSGTSLAVWEVELVARSFAHDVAHIAAHLQWPPLRVQAALRYAEAYPEEIEFALQDNASYDFATISRMLPGAERFVTSAMVEEHVQESPPDVQHMASAER